MNYLFLQKMSVMQKCHILNHRQLGAFELYPYGLRLEHFAVTEKCNKIVLKNKRKLYGVKLRQCHLSISFSARSHV